jgi:hypothetical protein
MLKQGSSDPTSPRREASLFDLPGSSEPGLFFWGLAIIAQVVVTGFAPCPKPAAHKTIARLGGAVAVPRQHR